MRNRVLSWWRERQACNADIEDSQPVLPWLAAAALIGALSGIALCIAIVTHPRNQPSSTPLVLDHAP